MGPRGQAQGTVQPGLGHTGLQRPVSLAFHWAWHFLPLPCLGQPEGRGQDQGGHVLAGKHRLSWKRPGQHLCWVYNWLLVSPNGRWPSAWSQRVSIGVRFLEMSGAILSLPFHLYSLWGLQGMAASPRVLPSLMKRVSLEAHSFLCLHQPGFGTGCAWLVL